jgi:hypothetical protein
MSKNLFKDTETLAGYLTVHSGSLLLSDGVWDSTHLHEESKLNIDLEEEGSYKIPVTTIRQNGKRFILISLDAAIPRLPNTEKTVPVESDED